MGRYVTGAFQWKFAVAEQCSSFGEELEKLVSNEAGAVNRFISTSGSGEIVRFYIEDKEKLIEDFDTYLTGFQFKKREELETTTKELLNEYWNKHMMFKLGGSLEDAEDGNSFEYEVEY